MSNNNSEKTKIKIFGSKKGFRTYDSNDEQKVIDLVQKEVVQKAKTSYHSVNVKINRNIDGSPDSLIAYMLRKDTYTADVVRVNVQSDYKLKDVQEDYDDSLEFDEEDESYTSDFEDDYGGVDFVAATPVPDIQTAKAAVEKIHQLASTAGLRSVLLLGAQASVANYKKYLKSGLTGFVNIGHGYTGGIVLDDGNLTSNWFQSLNNNQISPGVVYFNSCKVFNPPLQPAVMGAGARTYIGGIPNLLIGPSEEVCKCFWNSILWKGEQMNDALTTCEANNYPHAGHHGISGDFGILQAGHLIAYQHANLRGHHRHIFGWERNLNHPEDRSLNDQISSFVVLSGTWNFYRHSNYMVRLGGNFDRGVYRWVGAVGIDNDQVSSLKCIRS
jgi:hypothetical protein